MCYAAGANRELHVKRPIMVALIAVSLSAIASCSRSPSAPSVANVAGNWQGTVQFTVGGTGSGAGTGGGFGGGAGQQVLFAFQMSLSQTGAGVSGTYTSGTAGVPLFGGTLAGTATSNSFSGTLTWNPLAGFSCPGTWAASGSAGGNTLTWTSPGVSGNCADLPRNMTIAVQHS